ncbi:MAG: lamin tail domain-containing protein [Planctomycetales bacterium]|nr:lamin tail domain-containing protein [Planctomycetales bacterium]
MVEKQFPNYSKAVTAPRRNRVRRPALRVERLEPRALLAADAFSVLDGLRITEIDYHPLDPTSAELAAGFADADEFEFVEFQNISDQPLDLAGVQFTNGIDFTFPELTLAAHDFVLLARNLSAFAARHGDAGRVVGPYAGTLSNGGETLTLVDAALESLLSFSYQDDGLWPQAADGNGATLQVRDPLGDYDDPDNWQASLEWLGSPGRAGHDEAIPIVINEILANAAGGQDDYVELYNTGFAPLDLSGWYLSDTVTEPRKFRIPDGSILAAGDYLVFGANDFNPGGGASPTDFQLSANGESLGLYAVDGMGAIDRIIDFVEFGGTADGVALGRWPNATGPLFAMTDLSPDAANPGPVIPNVFVSELHYNSGEPAGSDAFEFIEVFNGGSDAQELAGWRLRGGVDYEFPAATQIVAGEAIVVISLDPIMAADEDPQAVAEKIAAFRAAYDLPESAQILVGYQGGLSNRGDLIELVGPATTTDTNGDFVPDELKDRVAYRDQAPWPLAADGEGDSLKRISGAHFGLLPESWRASVPSPTEFRADPNTFQVLEVRTHNAGFVLELNRPIDDSLWNLYETFENPTPADLSVVSQSAGALSGSVFWNEARTRLEWIKTGGPFEPGQYTITLSGRADGAVSTTGEALDGDDDGQPGGDFIELLEVDAHEMRTVRIVDFATQAGGQAATVTNDGIAVTIDDADGVQEIDLRIRFNPRLLTIVDAVFNEPFPIGWEIDQLDLSEPGLVDIGLSGPTPLPAGGRELFVLAASIPIAAPLGDSQIIEFEQAELNDGQIPARGDRGVQLVGLPGDASGNGQYSSFDAALLARLATGIDRGLSAYPNNDPVLIGSVLPPGVEIQLADVFEVAHTAIGLATSLNQDEANMFAAELLALTPPPSPAATWAWAMGYSLASNANASPTWEECDPAGQSTWRQHQENPLGVFAHFVARTSFDSSEFLTHSEPATRLERNAENADLIGKAVTTELSTSSNSGGI